jgi:hypothetical protein
MKIGYIMFGCIGFAILLETLLLMNNRKGEDEWASFRDTHHCTPVAVKDGSNRAGYQCDDGQVHYRWRQMR